MRPALSLLLALVIAGCASLTPRPEPALPLLPPASLGQSLRALQLVVSEHQGQQQTAVQRYCGLRVASLAKATGRQSLYSG